jgi:hypothetical protein
MYLLWLIGGILELQNGLPWSPGVVNGYSSSRARGRSPTIRAMLAGCTITHGTLVASCAGIDF